MLDFILIPKDWEEINIWKEKDPNKKAQLLTQARALQAGINTRAKGTSLLSNLFAGPKSIKVGDATVGERLQAKTYRKH